MIKGLFFSQAGGGCAVRVARGQEVFSFILFVVSGIYGMVHT